MDAPKIRASAPRATHTFPVGSRQGDAGGRMRWMCFRHSEHLSWQVVRCPPRRVNSRFLAAGCRRSTGLDPFRLLAPMHRTSGPRRKRPLSLAYAVGTPDERAALDVHEWVLSGCPSLAIGVAIVFEGSGRVFTGRNYLTYWLENLTAVRVSPVYLDY